MDQKKAFSTFPDEEAGRKRSCGFPKVIPVVGGMSGARTQVLGLNSKSGAIRGTYLVVRWLRLRASAAGSPGSIPGRGTSNKKNALREGSCQEALCVEQISTGSEWDRAVYGDCNTVIMQGAASRGLFSRKA